MKKANYCILCGSSESKSLYLSSERMFGFGGNFSVKKCSKCSLVFLDPQPSQLQLKKYYPSKQYYIYNRSTKKGPIEIIRNYLVAHYYSPNFLSFFISTFIKNVPAMPSYVQNGKILDLGCGTGDTLVLLKKLGWNAYGMDIDEHAISAGKKRGLSNLKLGTYREIDKYPDNFFDAIRLYHVIEHLDDPKLCLSLINKKLKKNGELVMGTPNIESLISKIFGPYWYNLDSPRHLFVFSPDSLKILTGRNGFSVKKIEFCSAGGIIGSIQYLVNDLLKKRIDLIHKFSLIVLFYPLEWILDKFRVGDVFTIRAVKK